MPFAVHRGAIADIREHFGHGVFPLGHPVRQARPHSDRRITAADRIATGQQRRPTRGALGLDVGIHQPHPLGRQCIKPGRGRAPYHTAAIAAKLSVGQVVHQNQNNVWPRFLCNRSKAGLVAKIFVRRLIFMMPT
jgi:hypothetical protein